MIGDEFAATLDAAQVGAEWAWATLYRDLAPSIVGYLRGRGAAEPDDLLGEVFLQVVRDLHTFVGDERKFRSWVFVIAHHRLLDDVRRRGRRPVVLVADVSPDRQASIDTEALALDDLATERAVAIMAELPKDQATVLLLRVVGQLTVEEVAGVIGRSAAAVKALQRRGLRSVAKTLARNGAPL